jgi:hypothetical protein
MRLRHVVIEVTFITSCSPSTSAKVEHGGVGLPLPYTCFTRYFIKHRDNFKSEKYLFLGCYAVWLL